MNIHQSKILNKYKLCLTLNEDIKNFYYSTNNRCDIYDL